MIQVRTGKKVYLFFICAFVFLYGLNAFCKSVSGAILHVKQLSSTRSLLSATPHKGQHFNEKAPHYLEFDGFRGRIPPSFVKANEIRFSLSGFPPKPMRLTVYICDNAKTYCMKKTLKVTWNPLKKSLDTLPSELAP